MASCGRLLDADRAPASRADIFLRAGRAKTMPCAGVDPAARLEQRGRRLSGGADGLAVIAEGFPVREFVRGRGAGQRKIAAGAARVARLV